MKLLMEVDTFFNVNVSGAYPDDGNFRQSDDVLREVVNRVDGDDTIIDGEVACIMYGGFSAKPRWVN